MGEIDRRRRRWASIVSGVIAVRVACAALFLYTFINDERTWAIGVFLFACFTDAFDGYLARRLGVAPWLGPYFDATADFVLIAAAFSAFVVKGTYPLWTLLLIVGMFLQFVWTSGRAKPLYDPVGKYYGVFLFAAIGVTLAFPRPAVCSAVLVGIPGFTAASLVSRFVFFRHRQKNTVADSEQS
jgi:phosphatidylglycerophosphate synthase